MSGPDQDLPGIRKRVPPAALVAPPEVVAVVAAAAELCWPRPVRPNGGRRPAPPNGPEYVWRFSGRWWSKPVPLRRDRPWTDHHGGQGRMGTGGT